MDPKTIPHIVAVERLNRGVVISFEDGTCGFYPEALLYDVFPQAEPLDWEYVAW